jgi:hypothetical protein
MLTDLWKERLELCRQSSKDKFYYDDLAELWNMPYESVSPSLNTLDAKWYDKDMDGRKAVVTFSYEGLAPEDESVYSLVTKKTYKNIVNRMKNTGAMPEEFRVEFEPLIEAQRRGWDEEKQRGGLIAHVYEKGQKSPCLKFTIRIDNEYVVGAQIEVL